jgi:hypothetical protein
VLAVVVVVVTAQNRDTRDHAKLLLTRGLQRSVIIVFTGRFLAFSMPGAVQKQVSEMLIDYVTTV